jgi:hypothetical protein
MLERADTAEAIGLNRRASALLDQYAASLLLKGLPRFLSQAFAFLVRYAICAKRRS